MSKYKWFKQIISLYIQQINKKERGKRMIKDSMYIYSLLHDIEELMLMHKIIKNKEELLSISDFIKEHIEIIENNKDVEILKELSNLAHNIAIYEENPKFKDNISNNKTLRPVFSYILENEIEPIQSKMIYDSKPLDFANIFPINNDEFKQENIEKLLKSFLKELKQVKDEEQLLHILEKYLWSIPSLYSLYKISVSDISLYDHLKTSSALALCLYNQYVVGDFTYDDLEYGEKSSKNQFILINGDISGIQNFIFNISSKGAAKSLKGRSVYIQLINDIIVDYLLSKLELKRANLLYEGGGNFYIIAPACKIESFETAKKQILKNLLLAHDGELYVAMDYILLSPLDFTDFSNQWDKVKEKVNLQKLRRWTELGLKETFDSVFGPLNDGSIKDTHCRVCGISISTEESIDYNIDENEDKSKICRFCHSFVTLTNETKDANYYILRLEEEQTLKDNEINSYKDIFRLFGYNIEFKSKLISSIEKTEKTYKLNNTNFLEENCSGFKFGAFSLPMEGDVQIDFKDMARKSKGDNKIALLKLDVDNLGYLFNKGFSNNRSISRVTTLSRMLSLYFEGYINKLIEDKKWHETIYTVFSGGDDTFVLGSWNDVLDFAYEFNKNFKNYVCNNSKITFSAGIGIYHYTFPIIRSSTITEDALEQSKNYLYKDEELSSKNKVTIFGETFNWEEFAKIKEIKTIIVAMMEVAQEEDDKNFGRGLLYKLYKSTAGLKPILHKTAEEGKLDNVRFWRLAYYLRDIKSKSKDKEIDYAEKFIEVYRQIVIDNLLGKSKDEKIRNVMIIPAAIKWAELETRRV